MVSIDAAPLPPGTIVMYGAATAPPGWLLCDGTNYGGVTYPALFAAIGTTFGGSGGTFNVPNFNGLGGRFPIGTNTTPGAIGGAANALVAHSHDLANHVHKTPDLIGTFDTTSGGNVAAAFNPSQAGYINNGPSSHAVNSAAPNTNTSGTAGAGSDSRPPFLTINFIIKT